MAVSLKSLLGGIVNDSPVPMTSKWAGRGNPFGRLFGQDDKLSQIEALTCSATLYGVTTKLGEMVSMVEWDLCRSTDDPDDEPEPLSGRELMRATPWQVWNRPNTVPWMTRKYCVQGLQQHKDLCGELWYVVERFAGVPVQLWPVRPDRMTPVPSTARLVAGYVYTSPDGEQVPLNVEDVLTSFTPGVDPLRGQGVIGALASDLAQSTASAEWQASFYRNSANPGGIITVGRRLGDTEWDELVERWRFSHQGVQNAGRVAVLEEGTFTPLSYTQKDMQFVESRGLTRQAILDAFGFPKFGIGDVDDVNRASAEASMTLMAQTLTIPRLEDWRLLLNTQFLPMFGRAWQGYEFCYRSPIPPDAESERSDLTARTSAFKTLIDARVDPAQASEVCGLPPLTVSKLEPQPAPVPAEGDPNARQAA